METGETLLFQVPAVFWQGVILGACGFGFLESAAEKSFEVFTLNLKPEP